MNLWWISDIVMFRKLFQLTLRKYTTTLPFFSKDISGPAHTCHNSKHTKDEAEADANAPTTKFEPDPPLVFNPTHHWYSTRLQRTTMKMLKMSSTTVFHPPWWCSDRSDPLSVQIIIKCFETVKKKKREFCLRMR